MTDKCCTKTVRCQKCAKRKRRSRTVPKARRPIGGGGSSTTQFNVGIVQPSVTYPLLYRSLSIPTHTVGTNTTPHVPRSRSVGTGMDTPLPRSPVQERPIWDRINDQWNLWVRQNILERRNEDIVEEEVIEFRPERQFSSPEYRSPAPRRMAGGAADLPLLELSPKPETPVQTPRSTPIRMTSPRSPPRRSRPSRQTLQPGTSSLDQDFLDAMN